MARHLRNGRTILTQRGPTALYGAAVREVAKLVDSPVGDYLTPKDFLKDSLSQIRSRGLRPALGAVLRQVAATYDPPMAGAHNPVNDASRASAVRYMYTYELVKPDGVVPSRRPINEHDYALEVPFRYRAEPVAQRPIAAIIHAYYPEILPLLLERLANVPVGVDLFLSTDTEAKRAAIAVVAGTWTKGSTEIRVLPNRGRDIGAKFIGFRDVYAQYDIFIHLHTKKSPHGGEPLARWRDYLIDTLIGSPDIAASNLALFDDPKIGVVFPQHLFEIRGILNWGFDYDFARALMARMGIAIDKNLVLEFPSGSMFWARSAAIRPLLDLELDYADMAAERGQVDGTVAHAVERIVLMVAEAAGFEWLKVVRTEHYPLRATVLAVHSREDILRHRLRVFRPCLSRVDDSVQPTELPIFETRPLLSYPSRSDRPRLNLLVPTVNARQAFGGLATARLVFDRIVDSLGPDWDRRIIATDAVIEPEAYERHASYAPTPFGPSEDAETWSLVDASERGGGRLNLRAGDVFLATAWWTAKFGFDIESDRHRYFGGEFPLVYLIQDDEPFFYGWGSKFALASATYARGADIVAIINSDELFRVMTRKYAFREASCIPYAINSQISSMLSPVPRERLLLVYARPSVLRNAYELVSAGLHLWQQRDPIRASRWRIAFLGEVFRESWVHPVENVERGGKADLATYADYLNRALVGLSLMLSPHPSYPPLEMAEAGLTVVTNSYDDKELTLRFDGIISVDRVDAQAIADAIETAVDLAEPLVGTVTGRRSPKEQTGLRPPPLDPDKIARMLQDARVSNERPAKPVSADFSG